MRVIQKQKDGISIKELSNGVNYFIHYTISSTKSANGKKQPKVINVTKKFGISTLKQAKLKLKEIEGKINKTSYFESESKMVLFEDLYTKCCIDVTSFIHLC